MSGSSSRSNSSCNILLICMSSIHGHAIRKFRNCAGCRGDSIENDVIFSATNGSGARWVRGGSEVMFKFMDTCCGVWGYVLQE